MWPLYLACCSLVELHGSVGLYRLAVKWGDFAGPARRPAQAEAPEMGLTVFFLALGLTTLAAYIRWASSMRRSAGERYVPTWPQPR
jgi:fumarate reductase subunit C